MLSALRSSLYSRSGVSRTLKSRSTLRQWNAPRHLARPSIAIRTLATTPFRQNDAISSTKPNIPPTSPNDARTRTSPVPTDAQPAPQDEPKMAIAFTCTVPKCGHRQAHVFSKRSYEKGIVIVTCSGCKNRHLIADHLGWFDNLTGDGANVTIEKLAKAHGVPVTRGAVGESGVFEFDGESSSTPPEEPQKSP